MIGAFRGLRTGTAWRKIVDIKQGLSTLDRNHGFKFASETWTPRATGDARVIRDEGNLGKTRTGATKKNEHERYSVWGPRFRN